MTATYRPVVEIDGSELLPFPAFPDEDTLTRIVRWASRSLRNTSVMAPLPSFEVRLEALDSYATYRPLAETTGSALGPLPWTPLELTLIR